MIVEKFNVKIRALSEDKKKEKCLSNTLVFEEDNQGLKVFQYRIWERSIGSIRDLLVEESHKSMYFIHPCSTNMLLNLKPY